MAWRHEIVVTQRSHDVHACIRGRPSIWGCGSSEQVALGDLIMHHQAIFGIRVQGLHEDHDDRLALMPDTPDMLDPEGFQTDQEFREKLWEPLYGDSSSVRK